MRFVSLVNSKIASARRSVAQCLSLGHTTEEKLSPQAMAEQLRQVTLRMNKLEAAAQKEGTEFEVVVGQGGLLTELVHNFNGPVRWYVTSWLQASGAPAPMECPVLAEDSSSTSKTLLLRSYVPGRAVIRVEPSAAFLEKGIVITNKPRVQQLAAEFVTTSNVAADTGLSITAAANELWQIEYWGYSKCSTVAGTKYALTAPAGATGTGWLDSSTANTAVANWTTQDLTLGTLTAALHAGATNAYRRDQIVCMVKMGTTAGDIKIQFASATNLDTSKIVNGSCMRATRVTEV